MTEFEIGYELGKRDAQLVPSIWINFHIWTPIGMLLGSVVIFLCEALK